MAKRQKNRIYCFARCLSLVLVCTLLLVPFTVLADPLVLLRIADETDMVNIPIVKKVKLSTTLKMEKNGDLVVQCLDLFSIPVVRTPFADNPVIQKLAERIRLQVKQKGRGVVIKLAFMF